MIAHLEGTIEVAEVGGGTTALLQDAVHLQDGVHLQGEVTRLQDVEVLLLRDLACSWHRGLLEVPVAAVEVAGGNVRSRRRSPGALEAGTEIVPQGATLLQGEVVLLQGEGLLQEEVHLQGEGVLLAGMRGEAMLEVGDVGVEVLLQDEAPLQEGVLLQDVARLRGGVPLQDVEEVLMMEVDLGGLGLAEVTTGALQEGDPLQGEDPLLVGALHHVVGLLPEEVHLQGEDHHLEGATRHAGDLPLAEMKAAVTEVPGDAAEEEEDPHPDVAPLLGEALHLVVMDLLAMMDLQTGDATVQQETTELLQNQMTARLQDPMTELHPSPLASLTRAGPRWPSVNLEWFTSGPVSCF